MTKPKNKPNYILKAKAISEGYTEIERKISYNNYRIAHACVDYYENGEIIDMKEIQDENILLHSMVKDKELFTEARKVNRSSYEKRNRLSKKIESMLSNSNCIFLTLTFTDEILASTSEDTRRRYITRFLKSNCLKYVANIDYGKKNEREHYHAVVVADKIDNKLYPYGAINFERIRITSNSKKLAKYVVKLTNHAIKETTKRAHTIYSRN